MAVETFEAVKPLLFAHEGGYSGDRDDPGNWSGGKVGVGRLIGTKHGISAPTLIANSNFKVNPEHMKALTRDEAIRIYKAQYWDTVRGDDLPAGIDYCVYDFSVNSGPGKAVRVLQEVVGARMDGVIGPATLSAIEACGKGPSQIIDEICNSRLAFMRSLKTWKKYGKGWSRRVSDVRTTSKRFVMSYPVADHATEDAVPVPKAKPEDKSLTDSLKKPETWLPYIGGGGGLLSMFTEPGPLQWALAFGVVVAIGLGSYYIIKRIQRDGD